MSSHSTATQANSRFRSSATSDPRAPVPTGSRSRLHPQERRLIEPLFVAAIAALGHYTSRWISDDRLRAVPKNIYRKPVSSNVPPAIKSDYEEACQVLPISPKASAALARRCLQAVLRDQGYKQGDLVKQIEAVLNETEPRKSMPTPLHNTIDAIRNFGNFSAHPITDQTTLQIVDVEQGEAEWCLEILEDLFDHCYDRPVLAAKKKQELNKKLASANKPAAK